jgi:hypothetical protein
MPIVVLFVKILGRPIYQTKHPHRITGSFFAREFISALSTNLAAIQELNSGFLGYRYLSKKDDEAEAWDPIDTAH